MNETKKILNNYWALSSKRSMSIIFINLFCTCEQFRTEYKKRNRFAKNCSYFQQHLSCWKFLSLRTGLSFVHICRINKCGQIDLILHWDWEPLVWVKHRSESLILRCRIGGNFWYLSCWAFVWVSVVNKVRLPG